MNQVHILTIKTASAASRLVELKTKTGGAEGRVTSVAIRELEGAIEELRVATEQLHDLSDKVAAARAETHAAERRYRELQEAVPLPCVFTDDGGVIVDGNSPAAELFHISLQHLRGKPLFLFIDDRTRFMSLLKEGYPAVDPVRVELGVRPRERKGRRMLVTMRRLPEHGSLCWMFEPLPAGDETSPAAPAM